LFKVWKYLNINFCESSLNGYKVIDFFAIILKRVLIFIFQANFEHFGQRKQATEA